jgi:hypothetical protein
LNGVQIQENALKFYMGMPIETEINIPQAAFEVTPRAFSEMPNTEIRTEFLLMKTATPGISKQSVIAGYPTLSLSAGYNYIGRVHKCLGS